MKSDHRSVLSLARGTESQPLSGNRWHLPWLGPFCVTPGAPEIALAP
jgi:hypothetical protein